VSAQENVSGSSSGSLENRFSKDFDSKHFKNPSIGGGNLHFNMQLGTNFSSFGRYGNVFSNYLSPAITYRFTKKFNLQAGATITNSFINQNFDDSSEGIYQPFKGNITFSTIFIRGQYQLNQKLTIGGTVYKEFTLFNTTTPINPYFNIEGKGMIIDIYYRPLKNLHINASFEYYDGNNPYRRSIWGDYNLCSPFYHW
jgi:hypothetical protein